MFENFGLKAGEVLSDAINKAAESDWNHKHTLIPESLISNSIVLSASLFGSVYLFSTSLIGLNKMWIKNGAVSFDLYLIFNGIVLCCSGFVMFITSGKSFAILNRMQ